MKYKLTIRIVRNADEEVTLQSRHHTQQGAAAGFLKASRDSDLNAMGSGYQRLEIEVDGVTLGEADMADVHGVAAHRDSQFARDGLKVLFHDFMTGKRRPSSAGILGAA